MAVETPTATGTGSYGLYWLLLMDGGHLGRRLADESGHLPTMPGFCAASARESRISCCGDVRHQDGAVAVDDLTTRGGDADDADLVARHRSGVGLALDHLERPETQHEDAEEEQHRDPDDAQAEVRPRLLLLGSAHDARPR